MEIVDIFGFFIDWFLIGELDLLGAVLMVWLRIILDLARRMTIVIKNIYETLLAD